jgi:hypothetical protein
MSDALDKSGVPAKERGEVLAIFGSMKKDFVEEHPALRSVA